MKSYVWYACVCVVLMFVASPAALADTYREEGGQTDSYGGGSGDGWGSTASASAGASGTTPYSMGYGAGWVQVYTDEPGWFGCGSSSFADAYASASVSDGTSAFGGSGGSGDAPCGSAYISIGVSLSANGSVQISGIDPGYTDFEVIYLDAFDGVGASCSAGAAASVPQGSPNSGYGSGYGSADVDI